MKINKDLYTLSKSGEKKFYKTFISINEGGLVTKPGLVIGTLGNGLFIDIRLFLCAWTWDIKQGWRKTRDYRNAKIKI